MPTIDEKVLNIKKPFKKKAYRPWNLLGEEPSVEPSHNTSSKEPQQVIKRESISNQLVTDQISASNPIETNNTTLVTHNVSNSNPISNRTSNQSQYENPITFPHYVANESVFDSVRRVCGLQKKILFFIVDTCILRGQLISSPIMMEDLMQITHADKDTIKTATQRLVNKKLVKREKGKGKKGVGGFAIFSITEEVRNTVIHILKEPSRSPLLVTNKESNKEPNSTYSSSGNIITTTKETNIKADFQANDSKWDYVDITALEPIGFTKSHLQQIIMDDLLTPEIVQDSINAFAFDLEYNNKRKAIKSSVLGYFMKILRSGSPYAPSENYESPKDRAMRIFIEKRKEMETKRQQMLEEVFNIAFREWDAKLSEEEIIGLLPLEAKQSKYKTEKSAAVRLYFKQEVWPTLQNSYLNDILNS